MTDKVVGTREVMRKIRAMRDAALAVADDAALENLLVGRVRGRFVQGVDPSGEPWPGLMESTIARKQRRHKGEPDRLLRDTERLYASLQIVRGSHAGLFAGATGSGFRIGITDARAAVYGRIHNYGLGGQAKRQFLGLGATDIISVRNFINRRLNSIAQA